MEIHEECAHNEFLNYKLMIFLNVESQLPGRHNVLIARIKCWKLVAFAFAQINWRLLVIRPKAMIFLNNWIKQWSKDAVRFTVRSVKSNPRIQIECS
jgi:hypothetical protein